MSGPKLTTTVLLTVAVFLLSATQAVAAVGHRVGEREAQAALKFWTPDRLAEAARRDPTFGQVPADRSSNVNSRGLRHRPVGVSRPEVGRIFAWHPDGGYSCSGSSIKTRSMRLVLTAAHCLYYERKWATRVLFIPDFKDGQRPYGIYKAKAFWVPSGWQRRSHGIIGANFDVGLIAIRDRPNGSRIGENVGALPVQAFPEKSGLTNVYGYPMGAMQGRYLRTCRNRTSLWPDSIFLPGPNGWQVKCNMAAGSSGGPWVSPYRSKDGKKTMKIDGLTSTGYSIRRNSYLTSPYLGRTLVKLIQATEGKK